MSAIKEAHVKQPKQAAKQMGRKPVTREATEAAREVDGAGWGRAVGIPEAHGGRGGSMSGAGSVPDASFGIPGAVFPCHFTFIAPHSTHRIQLHCQPSRMTPLSLAGKTIV